MGELLVAQCRRQGRAHRGQGKRIAGERAPDARRVDVVRSDGGVDSGGDLGRHPVRRDRHAAADGLADDEEVGLQAPLACRSPGPGTQGVGLVDDEQRARSIAQLAQRLVEAGVGLDDADVGERRLGEHTGDVAGSQRGLERVEVVELHHLGRLGEGDGGADGARPSADLAGVVEGGERLVDGAVVAPVEDEDLRPTGEVPGETEHETVGVGGGHRQLPCRESEADGQLVGDPGGVGAGEHGGDAASRLRGDGVGTAGRAWPAIAPVSPRQKSTYSRPSTSTKCPPDAESNTSGNAPGHRVIHAIGTPPSRWEPPAATAAEAGCVVTNRCSSSARRTASRVRSMTLMHKISC